MRQTEEACCSTQPSCTSAGKSIPNMRQLEARRQHLQPPTSSPAAANSSWVGRRHQYHRRWKAGLLVALLAAALLQPGCCAVPRGDAQDRAFEDLSILARAGKPLTAAVADTAPVISTPAAKEVPVEAAVVAHADNVTSNPTVEEKLAETGVVADAPGITATPAAKESPAEKEVVAEGAPVTTAPAAKDRHKEKSEKKVEKRALLMPDTQVRQNSI